MLAAVPTRRFLFSGHSDAREPMSDAAGVRGKTLGFTRLDPVPDEEGKARRVLTLVENDAISRMLGGASAGGRGGVLELVFLNGCLSEPLAEAARASGVPTVVCWRTKVHDDAARVFAEAFFEAVAQEGHEHDYRRAYWNGVHALNFKTHPTAGTALGNDVPLYKLINPRADRRVTYVCRTPGCPLHRHTQGHSPHTDLPIRAGVPILLDSGADSPLHPEML